MTEHNVLCSIFMKLAKTVDDKTNLCNIIETQAKLYIEV